MSSVMKRGRNDRHQPVRSALNVSKLGWVKTGANSCSRTINARVSCMDGLLGAKDPGVSNFRISQPQGGRLVHTLIYLPKNAKLELRTMTPDASSRPIGPRVRIGHVHLKVADLERALRF